MVLERLGASWTHVGAVVVSAVVAYAAVIALSRLGGLRSLAKMSTFDFAATVAVGSTLSSTLLGTTPLSAGLVGLALLFGLQWAVATLRRRGRLGGLVDNAPMVVMVDGEMVEGNLRHVRVAPLELFSQLRLSGVHSLDQVRAVIMETTGDLSVLKAGDPLDRELLEGVRGAELLR
jgi:uncharacterized membrane protein YcaP (DUF421 family)